MKWRKKSLLIKFSVSNGRNISILTQKLFQEKTSTLIRSFSIHQDFCMQI